MVHGACSSAGCYSMSDEQVEEIFAFARDAFEAEGELVGRNRGGPGRAIGHAPEEDNPAGQLGGCEDRHGNSPLAPLRPAPA